MAWRQPVDKPLSEEIMVSLFTHTHTYIYMYINVFVEWLTMLHTTDVISINNLLVYQYFYDFFPRLSNLFVRISIWNQTLHTGVHL